MIVLIVGLAVGATLALRSARTSDDDSAHDTDTTSITLAAITLPEVVGPTLPDSTVAPATTVPESATSSSSTAVEPATTTTETSVATTDPQTTTVTPGPTDYGVITPGQELGTVKIPKIDVTGSILSGSTTEQMAVGIGHVSGSPVPGQLGNAVLVGFRTTKPRLFEDLGLLAVGDVIEIDTAIGGRYFYSIDSSMVVEATDSSVITNLIAGKATLSLITCTPKYSTLRRLVVHAVLVESLSSPIDGIVLDYGDQKPPPAATDPCNMTS